MAENAQEQAGLIERILASPAFTKAPYSFLKGRNKGFEISTVVAAARLWKTFAATTLGDGRTWYFFASRPLAATNQGS
jgi:hypothetical protein